MSMSKQGFSLKEQLKYSWFNVVLAFVTMALVIFVANIAQGDREIVECHTALMDELHLELESTLGPNGETETWPPVFSEWHHKVMLYDSGESVPGVPECIR